MLERPKNDGKYMWTNHITLKMAYYRISPSLVKRIVRFPERIEEGIAENTVAAMKQSDSKKKEEIWTMYQLSKEETNRSKPRIKLITTWRYPGKSPKRNPIPKEIINEVKNIL
ncbi:MAG: hypothetical protein PHZ25_00475 [Candidatus Pacebacteria bacterium]|nr:hypothetical protein [Candidatus Paceibacterota bacterium]